MPVRQDGANTSGLAYGGAVLPAKWGNKTTLDYRIKLVRYAYDQGLRFFDTSDNYAETSDIYGAALADVRKDIFLTSKVSVTDPAEVRPAVESELKKLKTDYLDGIYLHGAPGLNLMTVDQARKIRDALLKLREEKVAKTIGISGHTDYDKVLALINDGGLDHTMLACGYISRGGGLTHSVRMIEYCRACIAKAHEKKMGIVAMKVLAAGMFGAKSKPHAPDQPAEDLAKMPGAAMRYVLDDERIPMLVIGMSKPEEVDYNINIMTGDLTYTPEDRRILTEFSTTAYEGERWKKLPVDHRPIK